MPNWNFLSCQLILTRERTVDVEQLFDCSSKVFIKALCFDLRRVAESR